MSSPWLSETDVENATTAILLGQVAEESILHEIEQFPSGVLLISLKTKPYGSVLKPLQYLDAKQVQALSKKVTEFLALDYDNPPVVKVSKKVEDSENFDYSTILTSIIREIDTTLRQDDPEMRLDS